MTLQGNANEDPLSDQCRLDIVSALWPQYLTSTLSAKNIQEWDVYFQYYTAECRKAIESKRGEYTTVRRHEDIIAIADQLRNNDSKGEIQKALLALDTQQRNEQVKEQMAEGSIRLGVRIFAMVDTGPPSGNRTHGPAPLPWQDNNVDLQTILAKYFTTSFADPGNTKFDEDFTAFNLQRLAGLEIRWTDNLADHLRLIENDRTLCIFHHATFLRRQRSGIYPDGMIQETLRTLDLLFPRYDSSTEKWLSCLRSSSNDAILPDPALLDCDRMLSDDRRAVKFSFWRDELLTLKEKFDQPRPVSITQFWYDRRNKVQWYTFWIAVLVLCLTIFFGVIQSVEGALQVYKAYYPSKE
jgi:hypothetical protein